MLAELMQTPVVNNQQVSMRDSKRDTDVKNSLLDSVGEGEGGMI